MSEPRSELRLRDLGRDAEYAVDLPDLGSLERRGRAMRFRRQAGVVAAAVVLATTGVFLFQDRTSPGSTPAPAPPQPMTYPGAQMQDLDAGTYELTPSLDGTEPTALVTVPDGWNSWVGPNRFDGSEKPGGNDQALLDSPWLVGVTVVKVTGVASESCQKAVAAAGSPLTYDSTVDAIRGIPGYQARDVGGGTQLGYPATRIQLSPTGAQQACGRQWELFATDANGGIGIRGTLDVYVVDVDGSTYVVVANQVGDAPQELVDEQSRVLASVEFVVAN